MVSLFTVCLQTSEGSWFWTPWIHFLAEQAREGWLIALPAFEVQFQAQREGIVGRRAFMRRG